MSDSTQPPPIEGPGWEMRKETPAEGGPTGALPGLDFSTFCLSFASSAMIHLGLAPNLEAEKVEPNLPLARQTIDLLALLEEKTTGNLTPEESQLLSALLNDLRLRFVEASRR